MFFLLATAMAQMQAAWEQNPTSITDLKTGDIIAIVDGGSGKAMTNNNGTSSAPAAVDLSADNEADVSWEIVVGSNGNYQFKIPGTTNYLYCTSANNGVRVGTNTNNLFTLSGNYLKNNATSRYVGVYNNADWRCYTSTSTNIGSTVTKFYKKATASVAYTVTLGDDNTKLTEAAAGAGVTLPSRNNVGDWSFVGWSTSNYTTESTSVPTTIAAGSYKPTANVTLYPMYKRTGEGQEAALSQTLQYDTWTYSGSTANKTSYRLFGSGAYVESESFDLSKLTKVVVYGGTYGGSGNNSITIGDGTNTWKSGTVSGTSQTGRNEFTNGNALSGTGKLRITSNSGDGSSNGVRISKVEIYTLGLVDYYISTPVAPVVKTETTTAFAVETITKTVGDADFTEAATLTPAEAGSLTYSSSNTGVATVDAATGLVHIVAAGNTTIKAEYAGNDDYEASSDSYTLTVNAATLNSIAISGTPKTEYKVGEAFSTEGLTVTGTYSDGNSAPITEGIVWTFEPATLAANTTSVTATATVNGVSASQTYTVTVSKKTASVAIENVEVEVGKTAPISATTTPAEAALTYTVTEGDDKISIENGVITGVAEGTATVMATFAGNDEFNAAETTFSVTVTPKRLEAFINLATTEDISGEVKEDLITWEKDGFVVTNEKGTGTVKVNNYYPGTTGQNYKSTRFYGGHVLTFTPAEGTAITKIEYAATTTAFATTMAGSEWSNATASANGTTVTITPNEGTEPVVANIGGTNGGTSFTIYYEDATPVVRTLDHITISDYKTEFKQGDTFSFGGKVMASYEEEGVADREVTGQASFSGYDMNVAGTQTVTVSYTEGEITKTATYDITVAEVFMIKVVVAQPTGGTFVVKNNATDEVVNSGDMLPEGTELKAEATPAEGYAYNYWQVYTDHHTVTKYDGHQNETYKLDKNNIEEEARAVFSASFHKVGKIVYSWSANGNVTTDTYEAGEDVVAPANPANITIDGVEKVFTGWVTTSTVDASTAPEYVTNFGKAQENKMYFAVYATATQGTGGNVYKKVTAFPEYTFQSGDKLNAYLERWTAGEYLLVYENTATEGYIFNGTAQGQKNWVSGAITTDDEGANIIETVPTGASIITMSAYNANGLKFSLSNTTDPMMDDGKGLNVSDKETNSNRYKWIIRENGDIENSLSGNVLRYQTSSPYQFRTASSTNTSYKVVYLYEKVAGVSYSDFTTGDAFKGEFKLVKSAGDLVAGREYIIVSKHEAGNYGLSIDAADSRQTAKYDDEGKELPSTGSKTNNDFRRAEQDVTLFNGDEYASINGKTSVLTLGGAAGAWKFNSAAGFLAMNGNRACLNVTTAPADNAELTNIAIDANNKVVIKFNKYPGTETSYRYIFLNFNEGYPRFAAYGAGSTGWTYGKDVYLYYREADPTPVESLAEIEANGINGTEYTIADELEVVYVNGDKVWAKDNAKSYAYRENTYPGVVNYLSYDYNQNNWIELQMATSDQLEQLEKGNLIKAGSVKGTYNGYKDRYHKMTGVTFEKEAEGSADYEPNTYTMASFWDDNVYDYVVSATGKEFFLMNPKIEEYCTVTDAVWDGSKFVVPAPGKENVMDEESNTTTNIFINSAELKGAATVDWSLNSGGNLDTKGLLQDDKRYKFLAIVTKGAPAPATSTGAPAKVAPMSGLTATYTIYPTDFVIDEEHIITEIEDVTGAKTVKGVRYFNVAGVEFGEAQPGLNIIVTEYSDGSHSAVKVIR